MFILIILIKYGYGNFILRFLVPDYPYPVLDSILITKLDELVDLLKKAPDEVFLQPHNVPDPDAIASCY